MYTNQLSEDRMTLVLSAPSTHDEYYARAFTLIVDFQIAYAKSIIEHDHDNVVIIIDDDTERFYKGHVPDDVLLVADVSDIWMRDFATVHSQDPVVFQYTDASMSPEDAARVQESFAAFAQRYDLTAETIDLLLDGGNVVDNDAGRVITTERFLEDNNLTYAEGKEILEEVFDAKEVAIIPSDDDVLAHADGMVSWIADDMLLVNNYATVDFAFREAVLAELQDVFRDVRIIEVPVVYGDESDVWDGFASSCGVHLNATVTKKAIYVPTFGIKNDQTVLQIMRDNTDKKIIPVDAAAICPMGGSVRCLTWQTIGENATKLTKAARK